MSKIANKVANIIVLAGDGLNCERETQKAFQLAQASQVDIIHINDLLRYPKKLLDYQGLAIPGGFSFGDDLGSGQVLALKMQEILHDTLLEFLHLKRAMIGICNGFQVMVKMGLLGNHLTLTSNRQNQFINRWVHLTVNPNTPCIWTKKIHSLELPIRHGEGAVVLSTSEINPNQIPLRYLEDVNGSHQQIAAVCDETGLILGMMPHPEAFTSNLLHPTLSQNPKLKHLKGTGLLIFESAIEHIKESA